MSDRGERPADCARSAHRADSVLMDFAKSAVPVGADLYQYVQESSHSEPGQQEQPGLAYSQVPVAGRLMKFQKKVEQTQNSTQGLTVAKTSGALGHGPVEAVLGFFLVLPVADEYLPLLSVSFAPTGLSDAAWPLVELKTETGTCLVELLGLQADTSLAVLMTDQ